MLTLQQMKDDISSARKDLVVFERKRAMIREAICRMTKILIRSLLSMW